MRTRTRTRLGRLKREVFIAPPLNHTVIELLSAAFRGPLIAARVVTVETNGLRLVPPLGNLLK